ncbi:hypothetical protein DBR06_SOUSAS9010029, partial [Sousa chinensis]
CIIGQGIGGHQHSKIESRLAFSGSLLSAKAAAACGFDFFQNKLRENEVKLSHQSPKQYAT